MTDKLTWNLLDRYFSGACSANEHEVIERWVHGDLERRRYLDSVRNVWAEAGRTAVLRDADRNRFDAERAWHAVQPRILAVPKALTPTEPPDVPVLQLHLPPHRRQTQIHRWWISTIAAGILVAAAGVLLIHESRDTRVTSAVTPEMREYVTGKGQRTEILLPDGTRVLLSVESRLRVPVMYGVQTRDIILDGEAFFEVTHNKKTPFRVHAAGALAEDLGTEFTVRAYRGEAPTVVVASGMVALRGDRSALSQRVTLTPGKLGRWDASTNITTVQNVDARNHMTWMHGRIDFKNAPLSYVARELERWYDIDIVIPDSSLAQSEITVAFKNQPLIEVLSVIARTLDVRYIREGSQVTFSVTNMNAKAPNHNTTNSSATSRPKS